VRGSQGLGPNARLPVHRHIMPYRFPTREKACLAAGPAIPPQVSCMRADALGYLYVILAGSCSGPGTSYYCACQLPSTPCATMTCMIPTCLRAAARGTGDGGRGGGGRCAHSARSAYPVPRERKCPPSRQQWCLRAPSLCPGPRWCWRAAPKAGGASLVQRTAAGPGITNMPPVVR
jgi:hypothetical protein